LLSDEAWVQAVLPVRWGGLGVRSISSLARAAFLASVASSQALVTTLVLPKGAIPPISLVVLAEADWLERGGYLSQVPSRLHPRRLGINYYATRNLKHSWLRVPKPVGLDFWLAVKTLQVAGCQSSLD